MIVWRRHSSVVSSAALLAGIARPSLLLAGAALLGALNVAAAADAVTTPKAAVTPSPAAAPAPSTLFVAQVEFEGNRIYTQEQLRAVLAADLGRDMTLAEVQALAAKVQAHYRSNGYVLAQAVVPQQEFRKREAVQIVVVEGFIGQIHLEGNQRLKSEVVLQALAAAGQAPGATLNLPALDRTLMGLNRLSGAEFNATLKPGSESGSTDMVVKIKEAPRVSGALEYNSYGSQRSGQHRLQPSIELPNLSGRGDALSFGGLLSVEGSNLYYGRVAYQRPVNARGGRITTYFSRGNVDVGGEFSLLDIRGSNTGFGLGYSQEFIRTAQLSYSFDLALEAQNLDQVILGTLISDDKIRKLRAAWGFDTSSLKGRTLGSVSLHQGLGEGVLGGMDSNHPLSSRAAVGADNNFTKLSFDLARVQPVTPRLNLIPQLSGQYAADSLVSSEQWGIGGFGSVAGQTPSAYSGDSGYTVSLESRYRLQSESDRYQLIARLDHGQIFVDSTTLGQEKKRELHGALVGVQAKLHPQVLMRLDYATAMGERTEESQTLYGQLRVTF